MQGMGEQAAALTANAVRELLQAGFTKHRQGDLQAAQACYGRILDHDPDNVDALHLNGVAHHQRGEPGAALRCLERAALLAPDKADVHDHLGSARRAQGDLGGALAAHRRSVELAPEWGAAWINLGAALAAASSIEAAVDAFTRAATLAPKDVTARDHLGKALFVLGRFAEAEAPLRAVVELKPMAADAWSRLADTISQLGRPDEALAYHARAIELDPERPLAWQRLASSVERLRFNALHPELVTLLEDLLRHPSCAPGALAPAFASAIHCDDAVSAMLVAARAGTLPGYGELAEALGKVPLLLDLLGAAPIADLDLEAVIVGARGAMLKATAEGGRVPADLGFTAALALQAHLGEFALAESTSETMAVDQLVAAIGDGLPTVQQWSALACYRALDGFSWAEAIADGRDVLPEPLRRVVERQIVEPGIEREFERALPSLTQVTDPTSQAVRAQYEANPYPRWGRTAAVAATRDVPGLLAAVPYGERLDDWPRDRPAQVLVAGCGTGQHAIATATRYTEVEVLAIDLSRRSLAYAQRKAEALGLGNLKFAQADILRISELERSFDLIDCAGVLHHMADPLAGLRSLGTVTRPGGLLRIALYSTLARALLQPLRDVVGTIPADADEACLRDARARALNALEASAGREIASEWPDLFSLSGFRDLVVHVQETTYDVATLDAMLDELGLTFLGFDLPASVLAGFVERHPEPGAPRQLARWGDFERAYPDTFRGMYQFWCRKPVA